jgi:hypothetical protein
MVATLLKKAEALTERDAAGRAVTHNNWACLMRQTGKLHVALAHMQRALALERGSAKVNNPADTHLNLCAVLSQLQRHDDALAHAQAALDLLQAEIFGALPEAAARAPGGIMAAAAAAGVKHDRVAALCIAYHNFGVESEFAKKFTQALGAYTKGYEIAKAFLGEAHGVTAQVKESQVNAAKTIKAEARREAKAREAAAEAAAAAAGAAAAAAAKAAAAQ